MFACHFSCSPHSGPVVQIPRIHTDNIGMAFVGKCLDQRPNAAGPPGVCKQTGAPWCGEKEDCQQFPTPCPDIDNGWYMGNGEQAGAQWANTTGSQTPHTPGRPRSPLTIPMPL